MKARLSRGAARPGRSRRASVLGFLLTLIASGSAGAQQGTPEQRRACTPDVYRLCAGEIPNARVITACPAPAEVKPEPGLCCGVRA